MKEARTPLAQEALAIYNEVQLCREMGWSEQDLLSSSEDFIFYASQVMRWDSEKQRKDLEDQKNGRNDYRTGGPVPNHEPQRIPLRPPPGTPDRIEVPDDTPWYGPQLGPAVRAWDVEE